MRTTLGWLAIAALTLQASCARGEAPTVATDQRRQPRTAKTSAQAKQEGNAFLAQNARKEGVVTLPSGLQYQVLRQGEGKTPEDRDRVLCHYRGTFVDGTVFDSSYARGRPGAFELARMIPGFQEALKLMPVGSKWRIVIPPALAYGERGMPSRKKARVRIGPNSTLIYEVELLGILPESAFPRTGTTWAAAPEN